MLLFEECKLPVYLQRRVKDGVGCKSDSRLDSSEFTTPHSVMLCNCPVTCFSFVNVNSVLEFRYYWRCLIGDLTKTSKHQGTFLNLFLLVVMIVDKTKMVKDTHENIDYINDDTNLVLASDVIETIEEAFKEDDAFAAQETDQESGD